MGGWQLLDRNRFTGGKSMSTSGSFTEANTQQPPLVSPLQLVATRERSAADERRGWVFVSVRTRNLRRSPRREKAMKAQWLSVCVLVLLLLVARVAQGQTLLTQTTWGGAGSDTADGVATAADGSSYIVGLTDSFTTDPFGTP